MIYNTSGWIESFENYLGQICKEYNDVDDNIYIDIYDKHYFKNSQVENKVKSVNKLLIQAYADEERLYPCVTVIAYTYFLLNRRFNSLNVPM